MRGFNAAINGVPFGSVTSGVTTTASTVRPALARRVSHSLYCGVCINAAAASSVQFDIPDRECRMPK